MRSGTHQITHGGSQTYHPGGSGVYQRVSSRAQNRIMGGGGVGGHQMPPDGRSSRLCLGHESNSWSSSSYSGLKACVSIHTDSTVGLLVVSFKIVNNHLTLS